MNEELQNKLIEYMDFIESSVKTGGDFVIDQAPLVVQEFLAWCFYGSLFSIIASLIGMIVSIYFFKQKVKVFDRNDYIDHGFDVTACIISGFGIFLCLIPLLVNSFFLIKVLVAPRIVILEKISELI